MSNFSQIQPLVPSGYVQTTSSESEEKDVDFFALRLLNKRARVRLSQEPIDLSSIPGKASLFAIANSRGWFVAVVRDSSSGTALVLSPLSDLRSAFATVSEMDDRIYQPQRKVSLGTASPNIAVFASNDSKLVVGLTEGSVMVYATEDLFSPGQGSVDPIYTLPAVSSAFIISISPNPGDIPELVAILRDSQCGSNALAVELIDVQKLASVGGWAAGSSPNTIPSSISWSPKGKQLALGMRNGSIVTYAPTSTSSPKCNIPSPPSASAASVISIRWLSASSFHAIYAQPPLTPDVEQAHFHVSLDAKINSAQHMKFSPPYFSSPGLRPPGAFIVCFGGWDPVKMLLFVGDSTSSDIGVLGCVGEKWWNLSLEETSTPSLPLDKDMNDTILIGLELDLTSTEPFHHTSASGEVVQLPPSPVMYAYASDGTIAGWHVLNVKGTPYPGMVIQSSRAMESTPTLSALPNAIMREPSSDMNSSPIEPTQSAPSAPATTSPFVQTASDFSQASGFGKQSSFGQASFGHQAGSPFVQSSTTSTFGQQTVSAFGEASTISAFGKLSFGEPSMVSAFGQQHTSVFGEPSSAFAKPSFGQSAFGQQTTSVFGQPSTTSAFGKPFLSQPSTSSAFGQQNTSVFGQPSTSSAFSKPASDQPSTTSVFGQQTSAVFGQPSTGFAKPSFGQPSFGQSSFGQSGSTFGSTSSASPFGQTAQAPFDTSSNSGGFGAFSSNGPLKFGQTEFGLGGTPTIAPPQNAPGSTASAPMTSPSSPSPFGQSGTSPFDSAPKSGGFGAFSNVDPLKFGQTEFGLKSDAPKPHFVIHTTPVVKAEAAKEEVTPPRTTTPPLAVAQEEVEAKGNEKENLPQEPLESISSSTASSFVDVSVEDAAEGAEESTVGDSEEESISDEESDEQEGQAEEWEHGSTVPPSIPSSTPRSRSTTPNAELPAITLSTSPSPPPRIVSPVRERSTTPPGSPVLESQRATSPVPPVVPKPPATSPFALTPRTGTRPVKSSPLASAPLTGDTEAPKFLLPTSKSAPPSIVPHPASPRAQFGSWVPPVKQEVETDSSSRPKTPPGLFGKSASAPAITAPLLPPAFTLPPKPQLLSTSSAPPSFFGASAETPNRPVFTPPPAGFFAFPKPSESPSVATAASPNTFGMPVKTPEFGLPPPSVFADSKPPGAISSGPKSPPPSLSPPTPPIEGGMQSECSYMLARLTWELGNLKAMAARATQQATELKLKQASGQSRVKTDLADVRKWMIGDIKEYGHVMTEIQSDIKEIKEQRMLLKKSLQELESNMLKAVTRKEEIIRFSRAQTDTEFAKMLKVRTLGPEYLETQSQLRRDIRVMRDRVQKLEDHLQSSKKRLAKLKTGKPNLKAPSLDTVNRTFRNIDIALGQQRGDVGKLRERLSKLELSSNVLNSRDKRLESSVKKPLIVIPNVVVTTAAALNAERSAQKLKQALLSARKEPLLNSQAASNRAPTSFVTPGKTGVKPAPATPTATGLLALPSGALPAFDTPGWSPETSINYEDFTSYSVSSSRRPQRTSRHGSSAKSAGMLKQSESLEASPTPAPKPSAAAFDWGPLATVIPKTTLSSDVRPKGFRL